MVIQLFCIDGIYIGVGSFNELLDFYKIVALLGDHLLSMFNYFLITLQSFEHFVELFLREIETDRPDLFQCNFG